MSNLLLGSTAAHSLCREDDKQHDRTALGGGVHRRSPPTLEDDGASSEVSTELGVVSLGSPEPDGLAWPAPHQTFSIFDWDDTLFPTTWLQHQGLLEEGAVVSPEQDVQLQALADLVTATLETAKRRGGVSIVTNAEQGWVEMSCRAIMPSLQAHLDGVRIVSARTRHEQHRVFAPTLWKCLAFREAVADFYSVPDSAGAPVRQRNIMSVGDSEHEMEALKWVTAGMECRAKTLKFLQGPSLEQLIEQHELVAGCIDEVLDHDGNLDYEVGAEHA